MFIRKIIIGAVLLFAATVSFAQADKGLNAVEAKRILNYLASDEMRGRRTGSPEIDKAADFIGEEFKKAGLQFFPGLQTYKQTFSNVRMKFISASGTVDGVALETANIIAYTTDSLLKINEASGFSKLVIGNSENLITRAGEILKEKKNYLVLVNRFFSGDFNKLKRFKRDGPKNNFSVVFVLADSPAEKYDLQIRHLVTGTKYTNVVGLLPGKSKAAEYVVFSGHYDHLGVSKANAAGDSIYNGANDDAAGTTAVVMLANYFANLKNNERSLLFVSFTAEEIGGFGSQYFSKQIDADKVTAMFNLEMIGTESKWGKNSAYITGFERSDFGQILQKNLSGTAFRFEPDPYPTQNLFYRSDNATLAALGVPAHTISTSKMDTEPNYHKQSDEVSSLDTDNMAEVIKAIALSSKTIISGEDTPTRVEKK
ncbi:MAG: M28 family peptidase [Ferruginibacter sp.]